MDLQRYALTRDGTRLNVSPRLVQILGHLASNRGTVVAKDDLLDRFWAGIHVAPNTVDRAIARIRRLLGEDPRAPQFIQTVPGQGYRFVASVDAAPAPVRPEGWDRWMQGRLSLEALDAEQLDEATRIFEGVLEAEPDCAAAHAALANACFLRYELTRLDVVPNRALLQRALQHAERACLEDPGSGEAWATLGYVLSSAGQVPQARAAARRAVALQPRNWRHQFRLAMVCWGQERLDAVDRTLGLMPDFAPARFLAAMVFVARGAFAAAEELAAAGAARQSHDARHASLFPACGLYWLLGLLQLRDGRIAEALESFDREISDTRRTSIYLREYQMNALVGTGYANMAASRIAAAAEAFRQAAELAPCSGRALLGLQQAWAGSGRTADAESLSPRISACQTGLATGGRAMEAALLTAGIEAARGSPQAACSVLHRALESALPGQSGWIVPIDAALALVRQEPAFESASALLSARAG